MSGGATDSEKMADPKNRVIDTSALLALRGNERGADYVEQILSDTRKKRGRVLLSFITRMEVLYIIQRAEGEEQAQHALRLIDSFPIEWITCEAAILNAAASLKARGKLSVADSWIAATAMVYGAVLVHRDPEFASVPEIPQESLDSR